MLSQTEALDRRADTAEKEVIGFHCMRTKRIAEKQARRDRKRQELQKFLKSQNLQLGLLRSQQVEAERARQPRALRHWRKLKWAVKLGVCM